MKYFRSNIIRIITAVLIMVVSVKVGMVEYILDTQTSSSINLEENLYFSTTECVNEENASNDECHLRRVKKNLNRTTHLNFANLYLPFSIKSQTKHITTHIAFPHRTSRHLSALFCTLLI